MSGEAGPRGRARPLGIVVTPGEALGRPPRRPRPGSAADTQAPAAPDAPVAPVAPSRASGGALNRIFVEGLQVEAEVGCFRHEHGTTQPLVFDVSLDLDPTRRTLRDRLDEVVDYDMVAAGVRAVLSAGHVQLVESVAERLATHLLADPRVLSVRIRIAKPRAVPGARAAGVEIVRP